MYGVLSLAYGFLLGLPLTTVRMKAAQAPRYLVISHLSAIIQGAVHLALTAAVALSTLPTLVEVGESMLLVGGSLFFVLGATLDWLQQVGDHFAEQSPGWKLLAVSGPLHIAGIAIFVIGVVSSAMTLL